MSSQNIRMGFFFASLSFIANLYAPSNLKSKHIGDLHTPGVRIYSRK